jgi:hypothetical protein
MDPPTIVEWLACGTDIAIVFGFVSETLWTVERAPLSMDTVPGPHVGSDAETPRSRTWCQPPPILVPVLAIVRNEPACLVRPPSPDSSELRCLALPRSRNCGCPPGNCRNTPAGRRAAVLTENSIALKKGEWHLEKERIPRSQKNTCRIDAL